MSILETVNIDDRVGFLLNVMLSKNSNFIWQYKNTRINSYDQLEIFFSKLLQDLVNPKD